MSIFREAITEDGVVDVAYLALFWLMVMVLGAITFACVMTAAAFLRCTGACTFDPQPLGIAVGAICTGFATALGALAGYMVATRHDRKPRDAGTP